jgi:hypothetical protein
MANLIEELDAVFKAVVARDGEALEKANKILHDKVRDLDTIAAADVLNNVSSIIQWYQHCREL